jgi:hypothetical protein
MLDQPASPVGDDGEHDDQLENERTPDHPVQNGCQALPGRTRVRLLDDDDRDGEQGGDEQGHLEPPGYPVAARCRLRRGSTTGGEPASERHTLSTSSSPLVYFSPSKIPKDGTHRVEREVLYVTSETVRVEGRFVRSSRVGVIVVGGIIDGRVR